MAEITIIGSLPHLNAYIQKERSNRFMGAKLKKDATELVTWQAKKYAGKVKEFPVNIVFTWHVPSNRGKLPDPDNIAFKQKFVLDGLVHAGVLPDDTYKYIESLMHQFEWNVAEEKVIVGLF